MTGRPFLRPDEQDQLAALWSDPAMRVRDIAARLGIATGTVTNYARRLGLPRRKPGRRPAEPEPDGPPRDLGGEWRPRGGILVWSPD